MTKINNKYRLTENELKILAYTAEGLSNTEIAQRLYISKHTVKAVETKIFRKMNVKNRVNAVYRAAIERVLS